MEFRFFVELSPYILSLLITIGVGWAAWKRRSIPGADLFAGVTLCETIWIVGYIFQLVVPGLAEKIFWNNVQFFGAVLAPLAYLGFSIQYARPKILGLKWTSWMFFSPLALALLVFIWTDNWHGLFRGAVTLETEGMFTRLVFENGPGFGLYTLFAYSMLIITTLILVARFLNAPTLYRLQISVVMTGILIPWLITIVTALELVPFTLHDITPISFGFSNLVIAWALFRYRLFQVIPVARDYLVDLMWEGILVLDQNLRIVDTNLAARKFLSIQSETCFGEHIGRYLSLEPAWFEKLGKTETLKQEMRIRVEDKPHYFEVQSTQMDFNGVPYGYYLVTLRDIQDRKDIEEKLQLLATTDELTGAYNRRNVFAMAESEIERANTTSHPLCLIMFDVDHFKQINDQYGHLIGDQVLENLALCCQSNLRAMDIFGRYGGEEFIVVLPDTELKTAGGIAERLRQVVEAYELCVGWDTVRITISLGVASLGSCEKKELDELIQLADQALYQAKAAGRNGVYIKG